MDPIQKKVWDLHKALSTELEDAELHPVLRANYLSIVKNLDALASAYEFLVVEGVSAKTMEVNEAIAADWANPDKQVDPYSPHYAVIDEDVEEVK